MKIGVVAYEMEGAATGVGRYLEGLLQGITELAAAPPEEAAGPAELARTAEWLFFFKGDPFPHPLFARQPGARPNVQPIFDGRPDARPILWEQLRLPSLLRRHALDLLFSPAYGLPPGVACPTVVTVHDLSFERLPEEFSWKERWRRRGLARRAARNASRVLAVSRAMADEIAATYRVDADRLGVVPHGVDPKFRADAPRAVDLAALAPLAIRPPYLLYVGSILPRRCLDLVIGAFAAVAPEHPELRLVIAGDNRLRRPQQLGEWIAASGCEGRISLLGYVPEALLPALYRRAEASFYLSTYEGYGLPPLESLAAATPAIVAPGLALDELWPDYPYRCSGLDLPAVVATTRKLLAHSDEATWHGRVGSSRMSRQTWRQSATQFLGELVKATR